MSNSEAIKVLGYHGYTIKKDYISDENLESIKKQLTVTPFVPPDFSNFRPEPFKLYQESKSKIYLPKIYGIDNFGLPDKIKLHRGKEINLDFVGELRPEQIAPAEAYLQCANDPLKRGGILSLRCGSGKTVLAIYLICQLKKKTLIIVHKDFLLQQWKERINQFTPKAEVGLIKGKIVDVENKDIIMGSLQSIAMKEYDETIFHDIGNIVIDECIPGRQYIVTKDGPIKIKNIYYKWINKEKIPQIKSFNQNNKTYEWKNVTYGWEKTTNELIKISFGKKSMKCTKNHSLLSLNGMMKAQDLNIGDSIISFSDNEKNDNLNAKSLNDDQYQLLLGSILGDGSINKLPSNRYRLRITHGMEQKQYCEWKASMFGVSTKKINNNGYGLGKEAVVMCSKLFDLPYNIENNKKNLPQWVIDNIDPRGMAIWYMDDGSLDRRKYNAKLCTYGFDFETHKRFQKKFLTYNIKVDIVGNKRWILSFNTDNTFKFLNLIHEYIHPNILYKIINNNYLQDYQEYINSCKDYRRIGNINPFKLKLNDMYVINGNTYACVSCKKNHELHLHSNNVKFCHIVPNNFMYNPDNISKYNWDNKFLSYSTMKISKISYQELKEEIKVYDIEVSDNHTFVCCDEINNNGIVVSNCHHLGAECFSQALKKVNFEYSLGLSATVTRKDGLTKVFKWHLGDVVYSEKNRGDNVEISIKEYYKTDSDYNKLCYTYGSRLNRPRMINNICNYLPRTQYIVDLIDKLLIDEPERRILLLSDRRSHLENFHELLDLKAIDNGYYMGGISTQQLKKNEKCTVILGTFAISSEGLDISGLNTLILASPKSDIIQSVGRILRDKIQWRKYIPLVIDIVDKFSVFERQGDKRKKYYEKCKYTIIEDKLETVKQKDIVLDGFSFKDID